MRFLLFICLFLLFSKVASKRLCMRFLLFIYYYYYFSKSRPSDSVCVLSDFWVAAGGVRTRVGGFFMSWQNHLTSAAQCNRHFFKNTYRVEWSWAFIKMAILKRCARKPDASKIVTTKSERECPWNPRWRMDSVTKSKIFWLSQRPNKYSRGGLGTPLLDALEKLI
jgi:hypothetical protein